MEGGDSVKLFHGSPVSGLMELQPGKKSAVFATADWLVAFVFAGVRITPGRTKVRVVRDIVELDLTRSQYDHILNHHDSVSVYTVAGSFEPSSDWTSEFLSLSPVGIYDEEIIDDYGDKLWELILEGSIKLLVQN